MTNVPPASIDGTSGLPDSPLTVDVSWRNEPGINRAYAWLSDGTVIGHRDLHTGMDHPTGVGRAELLAAAVDRWLTTYGVPCPQVGPHVEPPRIPPPGGGLRRRWRRRKALRADAANRRAWDEWRLDRPTWRVPIDPPNGGWRDLVRNDAGQALWERAAALPQPGFFDLAGKQELRAWRAGAQGEETVAKELWRLARPGQWRYVHSVPVGNRGSDIDHVLVGPGGVFTINTKHHRGANIWVGGNTFMVNGQRHPYVRNSRHEAERASRLLAKACGFPVTARGLIVVVGAREVRIRESPADVGVTERIVLRRWLSRSATVLTSEQVDAVFEQVRRSTTWSPTART